MNRLVKAMPSASDAPKASYDRIVSAVRRAPKLAVVFFNLQGGVSVAAREHTRNPFTFSRVIGYYAPDCPQEWIWEDLEYMGVNAL